jgi:hypothetical protein
MVKYTLLSACAAFVILGVTIARAQQMPSGGDAAYITKAMSAAPAAIAKDASVIMMQKDGSMRTLQHGTNGYTCMIMPGDTPMCADANAMAWVQAFVKHAPPPNVTGFMYMLAGDNGTSNTDPMATAPTSDNHWVKTGPHVMVVGPTVKTMQGISRSPQADPSKPFVMWPGTPYEHLMIPIQ